MKRCCPAEPSDFLAAVPLPAEESVADEQLAALAKALAHPVRVRILRMLAKRDARMCADIVDELPLAQSTVSEHLRILRAAGLVAAREDGVRTGYCIDPVALVRLKALIDHALPTPRHTLQHQP
jgi:ArsR family transcriptional regulator, arsenate/arsenite/antimonite-responsive transcriptional repressor